MVSLSSFNGLFITLEGGEGAGKSTLMHQLANYLRDQGYQVIITREPGGTSLGEEIRQWLLMHRSSVSIGSQAELLLFLAARAQHIEEVIRPALQDKAVVLCDRFNDSTIAYQGAARGLSMEYVKRLCQLVCGEIQPHLTLFLDVEPGVGLKRTKKIAKEQAAIGELDRIESQTMDFHGEVRAAFKTLAQQEPARIRQIDANQSQDEVFLQALQALKTFLLR